MKKLFGEKKPAENTAREAMRKRQWSKALEYYDARAKEHERDYALWNLIGDLAMNAKSRSRAVDAWRRAMEGYSTEGLYENVLGVARKMIRRTPEEDDVYLRMAEAYLGLDYPADCLSAMRSYVKLAKQRSESDLRAMFRRVTEYEIQHEHLLDELMSLYTETGVEDLELQRKLEQYVTTQRARASQPALKAPAPPAAVEQETPEQFTMPAAAPRGDFTESYGLMGLDASGGNDDYVPVAGYQFAPSGAGEFDSGSSFGGMNGSNGAVEDEGLIPTSEGKDHYDLGMVYREMKLWDAAIGEFEKAKNDPALRTRSTLALAECMQESGDLQGALSLLEREKEASGGSRTERMGLHFQLGVIHELLGNLEEALQQFEWVRAQNNNHAEAEQKVASLSKRLGKAVAR